MRRVARCSFAVLLWSAAASAALGQVQEKKFLEEERRREMDERRRGDEDLHQSILWDVGGWIHTEVIQLDDRPFSDQRTLRYYDLRLWGELQIERRYTAYVRLQSEYTDFNKGDQFAGDDDDTFRIAHIDQAYLDADFSSASENAKIKLGKEFLTIGRGLLLNGVFYAGQGTYQSGRLAVRGFAAHTILHDDDIDKSLPNFRDTKRGFAGVEGDYLISGDHRAYIVGLVERDFNRAVTALQKWKYDAFYVGGGARGGIIAGLGYAVEGDFEFGRDALAGTKSMASIQAFGLVSTVDYRLDVATSPYFVFEYMFGSGDGDRSSVTDVASGNVSGKDTGFLPFGFVQTGFSLFPRLSNIHIFRLGGSFRPLESVEACKHLEIGVFGYYYRKVEKDAPISDPRSFLADRDIGTEVDAFLRWRILSDVGLSVNFGHFMPGKAYLEDHIRNFISAGLTYSF